MSLPEDYTVGWICAIESEYVAAQEFLDEEHDDLESHAENDNNLYTLGRIGKHNVVIGCLPLWNNGLVDASNVARDMIRSFKNLRFGLMVGVAGGAPTTKNNIRLGDVVVSAMSFEKGAVLQYDFGATVQGQEFRRTKHLDAPPILLQQAVMKLKARHARRGCRIRDEVEAVLKANPVLGESYKRPSSITDLLCASSFVHQGSDGDDCASVCGTRGNHIVNRDIRNDTIIHYGLIASGNQVMKNADLRDRLTASHDVLCFEMEAAGLMNHFKCLIVRGISDYSDSHKNDAWKGYAAMAAAAYAKELLNDVPPSRVQTEKKMVEFLGDIKTISVETRDGVRQVASSALDHQIRRWIAPPDPSTNFNEAERLRHESSGSWFLQNSQYLAWKTKPESFLWVKGDSGSGKTVLSSTIIKELRNTVDNSKVLYFYPDQSDNDKRSLNGMIRSLLRQAWDAAPSLEEIAERFYNSHGKGSSQPSLDSLCQALKDSLVVLGGVWIVIDALDECLKQELERRRGALAWLRDVCSTCQNIHLLATSRPEHHIKSSLEEWISESEIMAVQDQPRRKDIDDYVEATVRKDRRFKRWANHPNMQDKIIVTLEDKAQGMFRWVALQLDILADCLDVPTLERALAALPPTLSDTYSHIIRNLSSQCRPHTVRLLNLLFYQEQSLRLEEAVDALAVNIDGSPGFERDHRMPFPEEIGLYCSSLMVITKGSSRYTPHRGVHVAFFTTYPRHEAPLEIRFAHPSVREWLDLQRKETNAVPGLGDYDARERLARLCLTYLISLEDLKLTGVEDFPSRDPAGLLELLNYDICRLSPFALHAATSWARHSRHVEKWSVAVRSLARDLLSNKPRARAFCVYCCGKQWDHVLTPELLIFGRSLPSALLWASREELYCVASELIQHSADTANLRAECTKSLQLVSYVLNQRNSRFLSRTNYLLFFLPGLSTFPEASKGGFGSVMWRVLFGGGFVNAGKVFLDVLMHIRSQESRSTTWRISDETGSQSRQFLSSRDLDAFLDEQLLEWKHMNPSRNCWRQAFEALSDLINLIRDDWNETAVLRDDGGTIWALFEASMIMNVEGGLYGNALEAASDARNSYVVAELIKAGAAVNARSDGQFGTALQAAASQGHKETISVLLKEGADINIQGGRWGNVFKAAMQRCYDTAIDDFQTISLRTSESRRQDKDILGFEGLEVLAHLLERCSDHIRILEDIIESFSKDMGFDTPVLSRFARECSDGPNINSYDRRDIMLWFARGIDIRQSHLALFFKPHRAYAHKENAETVLRIAAAVYLYDR